MNDKPNDPGELFHPGKYCLWTDAKVNFWLFFAMVAGAANVFLFHSRLPLRENYRTWPVGMRAALELVLLFAALLWARSMARRKRGMDELHRRITLAAWLFAPWRRPGCFRSGRFWIGRVFPRRFFRLHISILRRWTSQTCRCPLGCLLVFMRSAIGSSTAATNKNL
jgi:hypothetical protein